METETTVNSQEEFYKKETHCQSCGRFVGVYTRCPYCQALTQKRLSIRIFKAVSVFISTVGLIALLFFARHVKTPEVKLADLGPLSNFAHVRIVGEIDRSYGMHPQWGSVAFVIAQGEGEERRTIRVTAYSQAAKEIEQKGLLPNKGDIISVEGQVRFQRNNPSLLINASEHVSYIQQKPASKPEATKNVGPEEVDNSFMGQIVSITGSVLSSVRLDAGLIVNLDDGDSGFTVWIPGLNIDKDPKLSEGDLFRATGRVETFKKALQVKVLKKGAYEVLSRVTTTSGEE